MLGRFAEWRRNRDLADTSRAGAWSRRRAREQRYEFVRGHWRALALLVGACAGAGSPLLLLAAGGFWRAYVLGVWTAGTIGVVAHFVIVESGSVGPALGEQGEVRTAHELRPLRGAGWRILHHVVLGRGDVDTVLVGPAGIVVVETKGGTTDWTHPRHVPRIGEAAEQASSNARTVGLFLRPCTGDAPVRAVVALWPSRAARSVVDGVTVLPGRELRAWVESLPAGVLEPHQVGAAWDKLAKTVRMRDANELERRGPPPRSVEEYLHDTLAVLVGVGAGSIASTAAMRLGLWPAVAISVVALAALARAMRVALLRPAAFGASFAVGVVVAILTVAHLLV